MYTCGTLGSNDEMRAWRSNLVNCVGAVPAALLAAILGSTGAV